MNDTKRKLDIVIPSYNRPQKLFALLDTGLKLDMKDVYFVIIDDGSTVSEAISGVGTLTTRQVCEHFASKNIIYIRNAENMGLAKSWVKYYSEYAQAKYTLSLVDKDILIDKGPILGAIEQLEKDDSLCMVFVPLLQKDRVNEDLLLGFSYDKMSGKEFISRYVHDVNLMHVGGYAIKRVESIKKAGIPRNMGLTRYGLDDMFGIDIDLVFILATMGNVGFEDKPYGKRSIIEGGTEKYPLTFAYTYYQYAKRAIDDLRRQDMISAEDARVYLSMWHLLFLRGLVVSYKPMHGSELERGTRRIRKHMKIPAHLYVLKEMRTYGVVPTDEMKLMFMMSLRLMLSSPFKRLGLLKTKPSR
jgi:glycosyltransferase involved in cell wall biosynthesis